MDCNKDEAIRAKELAERKMGSNDFEGARKIALKAQTLYPELENITQLLSVCDVHCSAQKNMLGSEKDWYGILQVERLADELTIKKQYRRLALILHPDKNRFPGAEAAFKLICEANAVLSDREKKTAYDTKIRTAGRYVTVNPTVHHVHRNPPFNKPYGAPNNACNGFSSFNPHQASQPGFWTSCPFCSTRYQFQRNFLNAILRCPKCSKNFMGYEISVQGVPMKSTWAPPSAQQVPVKPGVSHSTGFQGKGVQNQGKVTTDSHNAKGSSASHGGYQQSANRRTVQSQPGARTGSVSQGIPVASATKVSADLKPKGTGNCNVNSWYGGKEGRKCNSNANNREAVDMKNKSRKRGRKHIVESSESYDTSSESDLEDVTINKNLGDPTNNMKSGPSQVHYPRRSTRKRQNVSYHEGDDDEDLGGDLKTSQGSKLSKDNGKGQKTMNAGDSKHENQTSGETRTVCPEERLRDKNADCDREAKKGGEEGGMPNIGVDPIEIKSDSDEALYPNDDSVKDICHCDDSEFNDFDRVRDERCFAVNQFWACYDSQDGMPRFYAKVKKVCASPFKVSITWLEADPIDQAYKKWVDEELPVGCGNFKLGKDEQPLERFTFSHQIHCEKGKKRGSFVIYPRQGEVWALFKDWDLSWSCNPENHREYKYEIVEVLSDFVEDTGITVHYLDKVRGFVSLFERSNQSDTSSFLVKPDELNKFSNCIPSCKMTGSEREGVPVGSFELDPASLPLNPDDLHYPGKGKMESENLDPGFSSPPKSAVKKGNFVKSESNSTPEEFDLEGGAEMSKIRRSPRGLNSMR